MVMAIVFLALMNITTLLTILYHQNRYEKTEFNSANVQDMSENSSIRYSGRYFRDNLNLNKEQMNKFVEFNPDFRQKARSININLERVRRNMLAEMSAKNSDKSKLDMLSDSIGYLHANLKKLTYKYYLDIKDICNQNQQKKLKQLFGEIFKSDFMMGHNMHGGPDKKHYGNRFNDQ